ncbi:adenosylmethionine decarboxylase [Rhodoligotrophos ferricapiens]|uniref:adenosylmethionine decarboxylase n=1 Tax=Rhodoligotrophos ferricapiens TaxID=3069264 RepID=UPI00315C9A99
MTDNTLFQVGMDLEAPSTAQKEDHTIARPASMEADDRKDHFIQKNGVDCAGTHLIIDLLGAEGIDDIDLIDKTLRRCVAEAGATLLHMHLHHFTPNSGVSGVAVLAESHISIHTWPERGYAALDVFMCGDSEPERCVEVLRAAFKPQRLNVTELLRGEGA